MTYDQAQSPRLGQRVPVESTYVQMVDSTDLIEAAYPGQLIFLNDTQSLLIWDDEAGTWTDVAGGVPGHLTFVGPEPPVSPDLTVGDTWYDSDDGHKQYVYVGGDPPWLVVQPNLPPNYDHIPADNITGGSLNNGVTINASLRTPTSGSGGYVQITPTGVYIIGPNGNTTLTPDLSEFKGQAEITTLIVKGDDAGNAATLRQNSELSRGGKFTLANGVTAPGSGPGYLIDWQQVPLAGYNMTGITVQDMQWDASVSRWSITVHGYNSGTGDLFGRVLRFFTNGTFDQQVGSDFFIVSGQILAGVRVPGVANYYIWAPGDGTIMLVGDNGKSCQVMGQSSSSAFSMFYDGSNLIVGEFLILGGDPCCNLYYYTQSGLAGSSLVTNGTFDVNITNWTPAGSGVGAVRTTTSPITGPGSAQINTTTAAAGTWTSNRWSVVPRTKYDFSYKIKNISVSHTVSCTVQFWNSGGTLVGSNAVSGVAASTVTTFSGTAMAPPTAATASIQFGFGAFTSSYVIDDVTMSKTAGLNINGGDLLQFISGQTVPCMGLYIGNGDFGAKQYVVASAADTGNLAFVVPDTTKIEVVNTSFPLPAQTPKGIGYDGSSFWTLGTDNVLYKHEAGNKWTTESSTWYSAYTWRDVTNLYETGIGPTVSFTMKRRARLTLTTAPLLVTGSGDPNAVGIYLARGSASPMHYNGGVNSSYAAVILSANFSSAAPGTGYTAFPGGNPAELLSAASDGSGAKIQLWGDGSGRLGAASWNSSGVWSGATTPTLSAEFSFASASTTWVLNHNLGTKLIEVSAFDSSGVVELVPEIEYTSVNTVTLRWFYATSGIARVVG